MTLHSNLKTIASASGVSATVFFGSLLLVLASCVTLLSCGGGGGGDSFTPPPPTPPPPPAATITWSSSSVEPILSPGESTSQDMTFRSDRSFQNAVVEVIGDVATFVTISPSSFASVPANQDQTVSLTFSVPVGIALGTVGGSIQIRSGSQTLSQTLDISVNVWRKLEEQDLGVAFRFPPEWTTSKVANVLRISNVPPDTQPNPESMIGICNVDFQVTQKPSGQSLQEWLLEQHFESGGPAPTELASFNNDSFSGVRELLDEITRVETIYLSLTDSSVLSVGLICGEDMQADGDLLFEMIISTITPVP